MIHLLKLRHFVTGQLNIEIILHVIGSQKLRIQNLKQDQYEGSSGLDF